MNKVNKFEEKIKQQIIDALNDLKDVDSKDQLITFLQEDIEELQKIHIDPHYDE